MSYGRPSSAVAFVSPVIACLVAVYAIERGRGAYAETEPLLMMRPPRGSCARMTRNASRVQRNAPVRLTATARFQVSRSSASMSAAGGNTPALLNRRSTRPYRSTVASNSRRTLSSSVTSTGMASTEPLRPAASATASSAPRRRPAISTVQPSPARGFAPAAPIPLPPPVTTATPPPDMHPPLPSAPAILELWLPLCPLHQPLLQPQLQDRGRGGGAWIGS